MSGDIECYRESHLPLALLAIAVLLVCFLAIPLTALLTTNKVPVSTYMHCTCILSLCYLSGQVKICAKVAKHLYKPLTGSFRSPFKWWASVELARRFVLIVFIGAFPANNVSLYVHTMVYMIMSNNK